MRVILLVILLNSVLNVSAQPQKEVKSQIDSLVKYIRLKGTESFAEFTVYHGENAARKWKDVYDPSKPEELRSVKEIMQKLKKALDGCNYKEFDEFKESKQSEGTWYVYTYACGNTAKVHLSFLKIKGKYALGDVDVEADEE